MIIVHAGNRIDGPGRAPVRFPSSQIGRVAALTREFLALLQPRVIVSAPASGADLVVLSEALAAEIDIVVVLPIEREEFVRVSVADHDVHGEWIRRFAEVLDEAEARPGCRIVNLDLDPESEWWFPANDHLVAMARAQRTPGNHRDPSGTESVAALVVRPLPADDPPSVTDDLANKAAACGMLVFTIDPRPQSVPTLSLA